MCVPYTYIVESGDMPLLFFEHLTLISLGGVDAPRVRVAKCCDVTSHISIASPISSLMPLTPLFFPPSSTAQEEVSSSYSMFSKS